MTHIGLILPPDQPPEGLIDLARSAEDAGVRELWLWEDCFAPGGMTAAAALLAATRRIRVGVGLFPAPLRNVGLTAMEIATLARMFPDRLLPGIGHGVQSWMSQAGARVASPLTLLREYTDALRPLLAGEEVTVEGRYVHLDRVQLRYPPRSVPLWIGAEGPKTLALAGEVGDGLILTGGLDGDRIQTSITTALEAREAAGVQTPLDVVSFWSVPADIGAEALAEDVRTLAEAGVTRVAVCGTGSDAPPVSGPDLAALIGTVAAVAG